MRRVILAIACTAAGLALMLSFKTRGPTGLASSIIFPQGQNGTSSSSSPSPTAASGSAGTGSGGAGGKSGSSASTTTASKTVAGDVVSTIYGPIQVTITVKDGKISAVSVPVYPDGTMRDQQINSFALPELVQETVAASSARIDSVSGATYTSQGYLSSLQSAIDKAGL
ncbi:MAG TPA: FMN-binding protein [Trebonia sp.]|nr:FMN-binding protein [Trebonia sp.]